MFARFGAMELIVILAIALLIFGPKNLPKLGKALGQTISGFKKGTKEGIEDKEDEKDADTVKSEKSEKTEKSDSEN